MIMLPVGGLGIALHPGADLGGGCRNPGIKNNFLLYIFAIHCDFPISGTFQEVASIR